MCFVGNKRGSLCQQHAHIFRIVVISIITWSLKWPLPTNILLFKNEFKLETRAIVVGAAILPGNVGGKYRCRTQTGREIARATFLCETQRVHGTAPQWHNLRGDNFIDQLMHFCRTLSFPTKVQVLNLQSVNSVIRRGIFNCFLFCRVYLCFRTVYTMFCWNSSLFYTKYHGRTQSIIAVSTILNGAYCM